MVGESDGMSGKLGGMEECHLGFIKGGHKCKENTNTVQFIPELISVFID